MNDDNMKMDLSSEIESARKKRISSFKLEPVNEEIKEVFENDTNTDSNASQLDTEAPSKMMADDFSQKYSLHQYTEPEQIASDTPSEEQLSGEEKAVVDTEEDEPEEISSFSNAEQKYKMDKAERKALKEQRKKEKARIKEKAGRNGCLFRFIWLCMIVAVSVVLGMFVWNGVRDLLGINRPEEGESIVLEVPENATFEQIIDMLEQNDLIRDEFFFRLYARITNSTEGFEEGMYTMRPNMDYEAILNTLQSGQRPTETISVQFKEGMSVRQVAQALEDKKVCKAEKFMAFCNSNEFDDEYSFLKDIEPDEKCVYRLEGYLFPDTYEFYIGEDADDSVRRFLDNFEYKVCKQTSNVSGYPVAVSLEQIIKDKGMTIDETVRIASLIQAEAANLKDMYVISSVFHNRLGTMATGGISIFGDADLNKLRSDATLYYPYHSQEDIPQEIVATFKSNYNTYNITGLPPGAICNPGIDAIDAAINPDNTNYYYFCHKAPTATEAAVPYYANTFAEHQVNIELAGLS
ncbi:MAG: endolytic transglycosylase MltG [Clostridia bacterium]|nr:endolytic transglycosylase MltG [Clostridia bacterium]